MLDPFGAADEHGLPAWVGRALRAPVATSAARKARLMTLVRAAGAPAAVAARPPLAWRARRGLAPVAGLAAAAAFAGVTVLGAARGPLAGGASADVAPSLQATLRDTLLAGAGVAMPVRTALVDTIGDATLRLVRFVLVAPSATRLALVGDFNRWDAAATPMLAAAESTGVWTATVPLRAGAHRYAFVLDDTGRVADPAAAERSDSAGRPYSVVTVPGAPE